MKRASAAILLVLLGIFSWQSRTSNAQQATGTILMACPYTILWQAPLVMSSPVPEGVVPELSPLKSSYWVVTGEFMYLVLPTHASRQQVQYLLTHGPWSMPPEDQLSTQQEVLICPVSLPEIWRLSKPPLH